jgi:hypothetical protein
MHRFLVGSRPLKLDRQKRRRAEGTLSLGGPSAVDFQPLKIKN